MKSTNPRNPLVNTRDPRFNGLQLEIREHSFVLYDADQPAANGLELLFNQLTGLREIIELIERRLDSNRVDDLRPMHVDIGPNFFRPVDSLRPLHATPHIKGYIVKHRARPSAEPEAQEWHAHPFGFVADQADVEHLAAPSELVRPSIGSMFNTFNTTVLAELRKGSTP